MKSFFNFFKTFLEGLVIGIGAILPGISSGVLCVIFGVYERLINSILNFFANFKENIKFLVPIITGIAVGIVLFGNILKYLFDKHSNIIKLIFILLIALNIPSIIRKANVRKLKFKYVLSFLLTFSLSVCLTTLEKAELFHFVSNDSFSNLIFSGIAMSAGVIIPGVSSTIILLIFGQYDTYLSAISVLDFKILFPLGIGLFIGSVVLLHLINSLLEKHKEITYFAIIGFVLGSLPILM